MRGLSPTQTVIVAALAITTAVTPARMRARNGAASPAPPTANDVQIVSSAPVDTQYPTGAELVAEYLNAGAGAGLCKPVAIIAHDLVVIVPDPRGSHLDWAFDSAIESVRRAHERVGYVLDRYWLPWGLAADSLAKRVDLGRRVPLRMRAPGVMIFRNGDPSRDSLAIVWLVGETPTRGVHSIALRAALDDRERILTCAGVATTQRDWSAGQSPRANEPVRIVGPIASGSARSLRLALDRWRSDPAPATVRRVSIVTGGASASSNATFLQSCRASHGANAPADKVETGRGASSSSAGDSTRRCPDGDWLTFTSTVNSVDALKASMERFLHNGMRIKQSEIAYLTESGTAYGRSLRVSNELTPKPSSPVEQAGSHPGDTTRVRPSVADESLRTKLDGMPLELPFPMNISRLRREYARQPAAVDTQQTPQPGWRTRLPWEDPASASESPEGLSDLTPATVERTIADIEQTLLLHKIRAVGILATDVRDRLFVASLIRERLRDVRVFLIGGNVLYLRPELNRELRGSLVVSTYPLFLESQFWDVTHNGDRQRLVFGSDLSEGTYNATLLQLDRPDQMIDYAPPMPDAKSSVWTTPSAPPVWITIVGRNSLLPVLVDSVEKAEGGSTYAYQRLPPSTHRVGAESRSSRPFDVVVTITLIGLFGFAFIVHLLGTQRTIRDNLKEVASLIADSWSHVAAGAKASAVAIKRLGKKGAASPLAVTVTPSANVRRCYSVSPWESIRLTLISHRHSWVLFRFVALVCAFAPLVLILFRPRAHGSPRSQGGFWLIMVVVVVTAGWTVAVWLRGAREYTYRGPGGAGGSPRLTGGQLTQQLLLTAMALFYLLTTARLVWRVTFKLDDSSAALFFLRAMQLDSGVTPLMPLLIGGALLVAWATWHINRVRLLTHLSAFEAAWRPDVLIRRRGAVESIAQRLRVWWARLKRRTPRGGESDSDRALERSFSWTITAIRNGLLDAVPGTGAWILVAAMGLVAFTTMLQFNRSVESAVLTSIVEKPGFVANPFDLLLRFVILSAVVMSIWGLYRLLVVWWALRDCLLNVDSIQLGGAFERLPSSIAALTRLTPFDTPSNDTVDESIDRAANARWISLWQLRDTLPLAIRDKLPAEKNGKYPALRSDGGDFDNSIAEPFRAMFDALRTEARTKTAIYLDSLIARSGPAERSTKVAEAGSRPQLVGWVPAVQDLIALYVVDYVEWVVRHLRQLAFGLLISLALTTLLLSSYPFEPQGLIKGLFFGLMGASVIAIAFVLFQMNRNATLSRITGTEVGHVTWDTKFVTNLMLIAGLPLLTVVSSEFPQVRGLLFAWIAPLLKAFGKG